MSSKLILCAIITTVFFQSINGMIIGECKAPNQWKSWLNVHRPTAIGLSEIIDYLLSISH